MMKKFLIIISFVSLSAGIVYAQGTTTLSPYYPSPFGVYERLTLEPQDKVTITCDNTIRGMIIYDSVSDALQVCDGGKWGMTGGVWTYESADDDVYPIDTDSNPNIRVGIGTSTPQAPLEVSSSSGMTAVRLRNDNTRWELRAFELAGVPNMAAFTIWGGIVGSEATRLIATEDGNVGIGIGQTHPQGLLHAYQTVATKVTANGNFVVFPDIGAYPVDSDIVFDGGTDHKFAFVNTGAANGKMSFGKQSAVSLTRTLTITNDLKVGVNTSSPEERLHVSCWGSHTPFSIEDHAGGIPSLWEIAAQGVRAIAPDNTFARSLSLWGGASGSTAYRMIIEADPLESVQFARPLLADRTMMHTFGVGGSGKMRLKTNDGSAHIFFHDPDPGDKDYIMSGRNLGVFQIGSSIGDDAGPFDYFVQMYHTSASHTFWVHGEARKPSGTLWNEASDARLKKNIMPLDNALADMLALRGVGFEWIDPSVHGNEMDEQMGFIAQEVELVFPDWVMDQKDGYKTVNVIGFNALTVEAVRELSQEWHEAFEEQGRLKARLEILEQQQKDMKEISSEDAQE